MLSAWFFRVMVLPFMGSELGFVWSPPFLPCPTSFLQNLPTPISVFLRAAVHLVALLESSAQRSLLPTLMPFQLLLELEAAGAGQFHQQQNRICKIINEIKVRYFGFRNTLFKSKLRKYFTALGNLNREAAKI